jgi:PhzF family phenazine biosynthesis protein
MRSVHRHRVNDSIQMEEVHMAVPIVQADAFTERPFRGNPAAVCILETPRDPGWMQDVAREMNLSETAFVSPVPDGWQLRWFTPAVEIDLCGHATLAAAHVLWESGRVARDVELAFHTRSGLLTARGDGTWIELDFPAEPAVAIPAPAGLAEALGAPLAWTGRNRFDHFVEVESEAVVRKMEPDLPFVRSLGGRGIIVTARGAAAGHDFVSRFFAPAAGIDEDPVTGSAHCALAPFWAERLGRTSLMGYQASSRGGVVRVRVAGDRVKLGGQAVTVLRGELVA